MPKAGSSTVQSWLAEQSSSLLTQGWTVVVAEWNEHTQISFAPHRDGEANAGPLDSPIWTGSSISSGKADEFVAALSSAAQGYGDIVVSSEAYYTPIAVAEPELLAALQRLSDDHEVSIACYVRPQHTAMEASWRQWGYRSGEPPSVYIGRRARFLDYAAMSRGVRGAVPDVTFEPRPLSEDLLDSGDLIADFAACFLGVQAHGGDKRENSGLPLEVVNLLSAAPPGMLWDDVHDNDFLDPIRRLCADWSVPEDRHIELSRRVLAEYAFRAFAAGNAELGLGDFVPRPEGGEAIPELEALDALWQPRSSPAELHLLFRALRAVIADD